MWTFNTCHYVNGPFIGINKHLCHTCTLFSRISLSGKIFQKDAGMTWNPGALRASVTLPQLSPVTSVLFFIFAFMLI